MMRPLLLTACLLIAAAAVAQEIRTITGRLTDADGLPMPGVNIVVKGTPIGTVTDAEGRYSIEAPIGSILVFSFIGMQTREVLVTRDGTQAASRSKPPKPLKLKPIPPLLFNDSTARGIGFATLSEETPTHNHNGFINPATIRTIRKIGNRYYIRQLAPPHTRHSFGLLFTSYAGLEQVNKLPSLQSDYAQGQPQGGIYQWRGADQGEIFSWGPLRRTLEYDGSLYAFDQHGRLVPAGTGTGKAARAYNARTAFRPAFTHAQSLTLSLPAFMQSALMLSLEHRRREGILPNSDYNKTTLTASLRRLEVSEHLHITPALTYTYSQGNRLLRGANLSSVVGSIYRTPTTFDNANGLSRRQAIQMKKSFRLPDGTVRSHAPGLADNPYGLLNDLPDEESSRRLMASVQADYDFLNNFSLNLKSHVDWQRNNSVFGNAPGYAGFTAGRITHREDEQTAIHTSLTSGYREYTGHANVKIDFAYQTEIFIRALNRTDGIYFDDAASYGEITGAGTVVQTDGNRTRVSHEILLNALYEYDNWLTARLANRAYFSNTVRYRQYTNFFPTASVRIDLAGIFHWSSPYTLDVYGTFSRSIREAPLLYSHWSYGSTNMAVGDYASFYESEELFFRPTLSPETERKFETGVGLRMAKFSADVAFFRNITDDFVAPTEQGLTFQLENVATVRNQGVTLSLGYDSYQNRGASWGAALRWSHYTSIVTDLYSQTVIPLAGFETVRAVLAEGKPVGAIYGTTYQRHEQGPRLIGADGFPIENPTPKMIGNPIPDWILGLSSYFNFRNWKLSVVFDWKYGGEQWNGTRSVLDYLGRSATTAEQRNITNYIFKGVDVNGNTNVMPVSFSDPSRPVTDNRWTRYGWDGVGEAYIEDASWFRLSELTLSHTIKFRESKINEIKISFIGRNLLLFTPYRGVDPSSQLFGYANGQGLDLFNLPATRSLGAQFSIKF